MLLPFIVGHVSRVSARRVRFRASLLQAAAIAGHLTADEAGFAQHLEVLGNCRLGDSELSGDFHDGARARRDQFEDRPSGGVAKCG